MIKGTKKSFAIAVLFLLALVESFFAAGSLQYYDEVLGILSFLYVLYAILTRGRFDRFVNKTLVLTVLFVLIGLLSNYIYCVQSDWKSILIDVFTFVKPFLVFLAICLALCKKSDICYSYELVMKISRGLSYALLVGIIVGCIFNTDLAYYDIWAIVKSVKTYVFFAKYPSILAMYTCSIIGLLSTGIDDRRNKRCIIICLIVLLLTQSGIGFIGVFLFLALQFFFKHTGKIRWYHVIALVIGGSIVGYTEIREYLLNTESARSLLFIYGIRYALKYFPLGAGFATFGSAEAAKNYSKLYIEAGFLTRWGMGPGDNSFYLHDAYYPMIIGQFGFIACLIYIFYWGWFFFRLNTIKNKNFRISSFYCLILLLIANLGQGGFSSIAGILVLGELGMFLKYDNVMSSIRG